MVATSARCDPDSFTWNTGGKELMLLFIAIWVSLMVSGWYFVDRGLPRLAAWLERRSRWGEGVLEEYDLERQEWTDRHRDLQHRLDQVAVELRRMFPRGGPSHAIVHQRVIHELLDRIDPDEDWRKGASA